MIRFYNGRILAMTEGLEIFEGEVWTEGDVIAYAGPARADAPAFERQIDLRGDLLMPGFKNAHTHSAMTFLRSYADDLPLQRWLFDKVFPLEEKLTPEHVYTFTKLAVMEYLTAGITASFDMYFHPDAYAQANIDCGFRTVICGVAGSASSPDLRSVEQNYRRFNALNPLLSYKLGFHAEYTSKRETLEFLSGLAHDLKAPVWTHNSETAAEVAGCLERHGMTPTAYFDSLGLFDYGGGGYHCVWLSPEDMDIFVRRDLWAVTCPGSNAKLASGTAPLCDFLARGVRLAVGTDGAASNNALDLFREMYLACVLQKLARQDAAACPAGALLTAATVGGARAMGLSDCDVIAPGKKADLVVLDLSRPSMRPLHNIPLNLVYSGSKEIVRLTMVAGRVLYENGEFTIGDDPDHIRAEAENSTRELIAQ